jgi:alkylhydroperoxidase/carboxymuconolactone decarboxylase family protein YurZ
MSQHDTDDKARSEALIARMKEARGYIYPEWEFAARHSIRLGATREELFEVLETCLVPGGAPTFHRGLSALLEVDAP